MGYSISMAQSILSDEQYKAIGDEFRYLVTMRDAAIERAKEEWIKENPRYSELLMALDAHHCAKSHQKELRRREREAQRRTEGEKRIQAASSDPRVGRRVCLGTTQGIVKVWTGAENETVPAQSRGNYLWSKGTLYVRLLNANGGESKRVDDIYGWVDTETREPVYGVAWPKTEVAR